MQKDFRVTTYRLSTLELPKHWIFSKTMFEFVSKESNVQQVVVKHVEPTVMKALLTFMCTGDVPDLTDMSDNMHDLLDFSKGVLTACQKYNLQKSIPFSFSEELLKNWVFN